MTNMFWNLDKWIMQLGQVYLQSQWLHIYDALKGYTYNLQFILFCMEIRQVHCSQRSKKFIPTICYLHLKNAEFCSPLHWKHFEAEIAETSQIYVFLSLTRQQTFGLSTQRLDALFFGTSVHKCTYYATDQTFVGTAHLTVAKKVFFPFLFEKKESWLMWGWWKEELTHVRDLKSNSEQRHLVGESVRRIFNFKNQFLAAFKNW